MSSLRRFRSGRSRNFVEIVKSSGGPAQILADAGAIGINRFAPGVGIVFIDQLRDRHLCEIRIAHEVGAIHESATIGLNRQVHGLGRIDAERCQVKFLQHVQYLNQGNAAGRGRRSAVNVVSAIGAMDGLAFLDLVVGQVLSSDDAATFLNRGSDLLCKFAVIEVVRIGGDALQCTCQLWLLEDLPSLIEVSVALEDAARFREVRESLVLKAADVFPGERESVACETDRRCDHLLQAKLAPFLLCGHHSRNGTGHAYGFIPQRAQAGHDVALLIPIHVNGGCRWSFFAIIEKVELSIGHADQHEPTATDIPRLRVHDSESESGGNSRIDRVPTLTHDFNAGIGSKRVDGDHHRLLRVRRMHSAYRPGRDNQPQSEQQSAITTRIRG